MRRSLAWVVAFGLARPAWAGPPDPPETLTPERAADAVVAAVDAADPAALKALALRPEPDPWIVADELLGRGKADAATAFARAVTGPEAAALLAFVEAERKAPPAPELRRLLASAAAAVAGAGGDRAGASLEAMQEPAPRVLGERLLVLRAGGRWRAKRRAGAGDDLEAAAKVAEGLGWLREHVARVRDAAEAAFGAGAFASARARFETLSALHEAAGRRPQWAATQLNLAVVAAKTGDYPTALRLYARAREAARGVDDPELEWNAVSDAAEVRTRVGDYAEAFSDLVRAREGLRRVDPDGFLATQAEWRIGHVHYLLGDTTKALAAYDEVLPRFERLGDVQARGWTLGDRALCLHRLGKGDEAARELARAQRVFLEAQLVEDAADALENAAQWDAEEGRWKEATAKHLQTLELTKELPFAADRLHAMEGLARAQAGLGEPQRAMEAYRAVLAEAQRIQAFDVILAIRSGMAQAEAQQGHDEAAVGLALEAAYEAARGPRGLPEGRGTRIFRIRQEGYLAGLTAARRLKDLPRMQQLLEAGRGRQLLEGLGGRDRIRSITADPAAVAAEAEAQTMEGEALVRYREALEDGNRVATGAASAVLDRARKRTQETLEATDAAERARGLVGLLQPQRSTLEDVRRRLPEGHALVYYSTEGPEPFALVVERRGARTVVLSHEKMAAALGTPLPSDAGADSTRWISLARGALAEGVHLSEDVRTVLVSPDERTARLPLSLLWPDRSVCYVPSGTVYDLLLEDRPRRGKGYLALGNPKYGTAGAWVGHGRAGALIPLPASGEEAKAVADPAGEALVEDRANERELRLRLDAKVSAGGRWAGVHFACHGLVDPADPANSALALASSASDDGLLTALEILRLRIPADIVVLSACDTAADSYAPGEGLGGLVRAFMFAGAPRVLAGLWKVDDAATRAFMNTFYASWKAGRSATESLRSAQAEVRGRSGWEHPFYWAPWVLWGLPE